jgi:hypothetical protein
MKGTTTKTIAVIRPAAVDNDATAPASSTGFSAHREPEDDFLCLRYRVWYPSFDCAVRTRYRTAPGCRNCEQGRFNLKRHAADLARTRWPLLLRASVD